MEADWHGGLRTRSHRDAPRYNGTAGRRAARGALSPTRHWLRDTSRVTLGGMTNKTRRRIGPSRLQWALVDATIWATAHYRATHTPVVLVPIVPGDGSAPFSIPV